MPIFLYTDVTEINKELPVPYIRFYALEQEQVINVSKDIKYELAKALNINEDAWELMHMPSSFFSKGVSVSAVPFIEVIWMTKPQEVQDLCAKIISDNIKRLTQLECMILFLNIPKENFYKNGIHY